MRYVGLLAAVLIAVPTGAEPQEDEDIRRGMGILAAAAVLDVSTTTANRYMNVRMYSRAVGHNQVRVDYDVPTAEACRFAAAQVVMGLIEQRSTSRADITIHCQRHTIDINYRGRKIVDLVQRRSSDGAIVYRHPQD